MAGRTARAAAAALAGLALLLATVPARGASRVTVRVEFYYGAAVAGGVGLFVWFSGGWESWLRGHGRPAALIELGPDGVRAGIPVPEPWVEAADGRPAGRRADLLRVRF